MSQIPNNQGAIKQSEISIDTAQNVFGTLDREDGLTLVNQIRNVAGNLLRKTSFLLISDSVINWNGSEISNNGSNILLKLNQNPTQGAITIMMPTSVLSGFSLANEEILYFKCSRNALATSFTADASNFAVSSEPSMPAMAAATSESSDDPTIFVPILARYDIGSNQSAWWVPHGIYWPQNTTSVIGSIITGTVLPNGTILPLHRPGGNYPLGTPTLSGQEAGWALADGAVISDLQSPYNNPGRDSDGFPNAAYSSGDDRFAPTLNGRPPAWLTGTAYVRGDAVSNNANSALWVALSSFTTGTGAGWDINSSLPSAWSAASSYSIGDFVIDTESSVNGSGVPVTIIYRALVANGPTATTPFVQGTGVWQRIWATDPSQDGNPFKRSGFNSSTANPPNTFVAGAYTSPGSSGAYGGSNSNSHTHDMGSHTHSTGHVHGLGSAWAYLQLASVGGTNWALQTLLKVLPATWGAGASSVSGVPSSIVGGFTPFPGTNVGLALGGVTDNSSSTSGGPSTNTTGGATDTNNQPRFMNAVYIFKIR